MAETSSKPRPKPGPRMGNRPKAILEGVPDKSDPEGYVEIAKRAVLTNYNSIRDETKSRALEPGDLYIINYGRILQNWEVFITSPVARGVIWQVTYNNYRNEVYLHVHQKIGTFQFSLGEKVAS